MSQYQKLRDGFITLKDDKSRLEQLELFIDLLEERPCKLLLVPEESHFLFNDMVRSTINYIEKEDLKDKAQFILKHKLTLLKPEYIKRLEKIIKPKKTFFQKVKKLLKLPFA